MDVIPPTEGAVPGSKKSGGRDATKGGSQRNEVQVNPKSASKPAASYGSRSAQNQPRSNGWQTKSQKGRPPKSVTRPATVTAEEHQAPRPATETAGGSRKPPPAQGNSKRKAAQHPLASKMRWSRSNIAEATTLEIFDRIMLLQKERESLRQQINLLVRPSTDKLGGATRPMRRTQSLREIGAKDPSRKVSGALSKKSAGTSAQRTDGQVSKPVPTVPAMAAEAATSTHPITRSNSVQGGKSQSRRSSVMSASNIATTAIVLTSIAEEEQTSVGVQAEEEAEPRRLASYKGASYAKTLESGPVVSNTNPIYAPVVTSLNVKRPAQKILRELRSDNVYYVEEELFQHLRANLWDSPLDTKLVTRCKTLAERFLRDYDCKDVGRREVTDIIMRATALIMKSDPQMTEMRNILKNTEDLKERAKNDEFLKNGRLGKAGLFKKFRIPSGTK